MSQSTSIIPGSTVDERFTLIRPLGRGSMGSVWLARHLALDIDVAIKFIDSSLTKEVNYVERFRREARAAAQLKSPHVVQVLDYGTDQHDRPFMAMEYLEGLTLGKLLDEHSQLALATTARIITHASRGLGKAHAVGIVHRDIKPENLFLCGDSDEEGFVLKILDFGVARAGFAANGHGTLAGQLVGSPAFMSPEQARGYRTIDHRADLFSLGVVAYQCVTGRLPFMGDGLGELLIAICGGEPAPPSSLVANVPPTLDAWFAKALAKKPHERFASAREMSIAYSEALGINASSGVDVTASYARVSLEGLVEPAHSTFGQHVSDSKSTQAAPFETSRRAHSTALTGSRIQPTSIADALAPLTGVPHTLGVALLDHNDECLLLRGSNKDTATYTAIAMHARTVAETVESIEGADAPTHLSVRFDNSAVYVRWVGPFTLVALGEAEMRALLLTVGSNKLADRLSAFMQQLGGVEPVANLLRDSGVGMPLPGPQAAQQKILERVAPATTMRSTSQGSDEEFELPIRSFWGFGKRSKKPEGKLNRTPTIPRSPAAKRKERETFPGAEPPETGVPRPPPDRAFAAPPEAGPPAPPKRAPLSASGPGVAGPPPAPSTRAALTDSQAKKTRVRVYRGQVVGGPAPEPEEKAKKKVRVYRGRIIDEE